MKRVLISIVLLVVAGCASVERLEKKWVGLDKSALIAVKGTPDRVMSDGFGGEIYTYVTLSLIHI